MTTAAAASPGASPAASPLALPLPTRSAPSTAFTAAWSDAHEKLAAGRYAEALSVLSLLYDDPTLGLEESQRLEDLLGQLAGTVIYSQKDLLLPPHIVAPGDTLQSIATPLQVPWQLVGKINGISDPVQLVQGEHLKVVRGPFDAVISVSRRRMSLQVGGNYAGSFPVVLGRQLYERVGQSVAVVEVRRPGPAVDAGGIASQVAYAPPSGPKSITLGDGLSIEGVEDPSLFADSAAVSSVIVSLRDIEDIADILGPGSQVMVRQ
jgi:LysM repeat protein